MSADPRSPVVLRSMTNETRAAVIAAVLAEYGIKAHVAGGITGGYVYATPILREFQVLVRQADVGESESPEEEQGTPQ